MVHAFIVDCAFGSSFVSTHVILLVFNSETQRFNLKDSRVCWAICYVFKILKKYVVDPSIGQLVVFSSQKLFQCQRNIVFPNSLIFIVERNPIPVFMSYVCLFIGKHVLFLGKKLLVLFFQMNYIRGNPHKNIRHLAVSH